MRIGVDEARPSIRASLERDADTPAEGHGEDGEAAVVDVLADQVRAPGRVNLIGEDTDYCGLPVLPMAQDRKSTRLNSSHSQISYPVFCLKKKIDKPPR